jgi:hypothetical protein
MTRGQASAGIAFGTLLLGVMLAATAVPEHCGPMRTSDTWNVFAYGFGVFVIVAFALPFRRRRWLWILPGILVALLAMLVLVLVAHFTWVSRCSQ